MKKQHLPSKLCQTCGRPFAWRKKWKKVWNEVKYCSERCRGNKGRGNQGKISPTISVPSFPKSPR